MRKVRILSVIIFVLSAGMFAFFKFTDKKTTDTDGPIIQMETDSIEVSSGAGNEELLAGVTATDRKDGDVTASLVIERMTNFTERGKRTVTIAAFDSDNNVAKATREIIYNDYTAPSFALGGPLYFPENPSSLGEELTASDVLDGDVTEKIRMSAVDILQLDTAGDYQVVFSVSNSAGDAVQLPVTVTIYDPSEQSMLPAITLSEYLIHVKTGESVDAWSYIDEVNYRGTVYKPAVSSSGENILAEETNSAAGDSLYGDNEERKYLTNIDITNPVDANTPGTYEITYRVTSDETGEEETGTMRLIVVVDE